MKKSPFFTGILLLFVAIFFLQVFSFIVSNEVNGIHIGKRRARLSPPVKQSVAFQMKYDTLEDIAVEGQSSGSEDPVLKLNGFVRRQAVENNAGNFLQSKEKQISSPTFPLFALYQVFRI